MTFLVALAVFGGLCLWHIYHARRARPPAPVYRTNQGRVFACNGIDHDLRWTYEELEDA